MKTLVVYYSYTGHTKGIAQTVAVREKADLLEIKEQTRPGVFSAYTKGCLRAMRRECVPIEPMKKSLSDYDKLVVMAPVWAGYPAPAINAVLGMLPAGKEIEVILVSGGGSSSEKAKQSIVRQIEDLGCILLKYETIKA